MRRQAAYLTLAIAEFIRDVHKDVLVLMDWSPASPRPTARSACRRANRPLPKATPRPLFTELTRLLERAGPGTDEGTITGLFSVLVDGDDLNEPAPDAVRASSTGIL